MKFIQKMLIILLIFATLMVVGCTETGEGGVGGTTSIDEDIQTAPPEYDNSLIKTEGDEVEDTTSINKVIQSVPSEYDRSLVRDYEILKTEDDPWKSAIRKEYRVLVPTDISKEELKATIIQIAMDQTSENEDIDAINIFVYDRKEDINGAYTIGKMDWSPYGDWGEITSEIAETNDRSSYKYIFDIIEIVEKPIADSTNELESKIYPMVSANSYSAASPERALAEYINFWKQEDWDGMAVFTQKTWRSNSVDPAGYLEGSYGFKHLIGAEITKEPVGNDVSVNIEGKIYYSEFSSTLIEEKTFTVRVIKESEPYTPSSAGEWGVNPISFRME